MTYTHRILENMLVKTTQTRPLVYLNGMRQCGKSTLTENLPIDKAVNYITLDNPVSLSYGKNDPAGFLEGLPQDKLNVIDEVQLAPELFSHLKIAVDKKRRDSRDKAQFLLTGSANIFSLPSLAEALVGRMAILTLHPFSASEVKKTSVNFLEKLWNTDLSPAKYPLADVVEIIKDSTFPELALDQKGRNPYPIDRNTWFDGYITTIIQRDVRSLADIKNPEYIHQLLVSFAQRAGGLLNNTNIMKETGLDAKTYDKYKALCSSTFLIFELPSWSKPNKLDKRFVKQKKLFFSDTSLLCYLLQRDMEEVYKSDPATMGHIFENFIATEIMKAANSLGPYSVSHYNPVQYQGNEVDFIVENPKGEAIGIEVKLSGTIDDNDTKNMRALNETLGSKFKKGVIFYTGSDLIQAARNIWALPVNYLWEK